MWKSVQGKKRLVSGVRGKNKDAACKNKAKKFSDENQKGVPAMRLVFLSW